MMQTRQHIVVGLVGLMISISHTFAQAPPVVRDQLLEVSLANPVGVGAIVSQRIEMAPGVAGQKHRHPIPVVGYVISGEIAFQLHGKELKILQAGDVFYEPANAVVVRWENVGTSRAAFVANYLAGSANSELIIRLE